MTAMRLLLVGDLVLDEPNADFFFDKVRVLLRRADMAVGHLETPHTERGRESFGDVPAPASPPENVAAVGRAGFGMVSLAGNHMHDRGPEGIEDTIQLLDEAGVKSAGAGPNIAAARRAATAVAGGLRVGLVSYNCVGPRENWAGPNHAGCAYIKVISHYEVEGANPGGPAKAYTFCDPETVEAMQADVEALRGRVDVVIVAFHKGVVHTPAHIAMYEKPLARAAIEAGADVIVVDGMQGGTAATQEVFIEHAGIPTLPAIRLAVEALEEMDMLGKVQLVVSGGIRTGADVAKALALGADAVAIGQGVLMSLGCNTPHYIDADGRPVDVTEEYQALGTAPGYCHHCQTGLCPVGVTTQHPLLEQRMQPEWGARRLINYLTTLKMELTTIARACGKSNVHHLEREDLVALTVEAAAMAKRPLAGTNWIPGA